MRKGSAAIVPLFIAIMLLFWFIAFMGTQSDTLKKVTDIENVSHLHDRLIYAVTKRYYELKAENPSWDDAKLQEETSKYAHIIMQSNNVDD